MRLKSKLERCLAWLHIKKMIQKPLKLQETRKAFAQIAFQLDAVMADVGRYVSSHTDFNKKGGLDERTES